VGIGLPGQGGGVRRESRRSVGRLNRLKLADARAGAGQPSSFTRGHLVASPAPPSYTITIDRVPRTCLMVPVPKVERRSSLYLKPARAFMFNEGV